MSRSRRSSCLVQQSATGISENGSILSGRDRGRRREDDRKDKADREIYSARRRSRCRDRISRSRSRRRSRSRSAGATSRRRYHEGSDGRFVNRSRRRSSRSSSHKRQTADGKIESGHSRDAHPLDEPSKSPERIPSQSEPKSTDLCSQVDDPSSLTVIDSTSDDMFEQIEEEADSFLVIDEVTDSIDDTDAEIDQPSIVTNGDETMLDAEAHSTTLEDAGQTMSQDYLKPTIPSGYRRMCVRLARLTDLELKLSRHPKFCKFLAASPRVHLVRLSDSMLRHDNAETIGVTQPRTESDDDPAVTAAMDQNPPATDRMHLATERKPPATSLVQSATEHGTAAARCDPSSVNQVRPSKAKRRLCRKKSMKAKDPSSAPFLDIPGLPPAHALWNFKIKKKPQQEAEPTPPEVQKMDSVTALKKDTPLEITTAPSAPILSFPITYSSPLMRLETDMAKQLRTAGETARRKYVFRKGNQQHDGYRSYAQRKRGRFCTSDSVASTLEHSSHQPGGTRRRIPLLGHKPPNLLEEHPGDGTAPNEREILCGRPRTPFEDKSARSTGRCSRGNDSSKARTRCNRAQSTSRRVLNQRHTPRRRSCERSNVRPKLDPSYDKSKWHNRNSSGSGKRRKRRSHSRGRSRSTDERRRSPSRSQSDLKRHGSRSCSQKDSKRHRSRSLSQKDSKRHRSRSSSKSLSQSDPKRRSSRTESIDQRRSSHSGSNQSRNEANLHSSSSGAESDPISASQSPISDANVDPVSDPAECDDSNRLLLLALLYLLNSLQDQTGDQQPPLETTLQNVDDCGVEMADVDAGTTQSSSEQPGSSNNHDEVPLNTIVEMHRLLESMVGDDAVLLLGLSEEQRQRALQLIPLMNDLENCARARPGEVTSDVFAPIGRFVCEALGVNPVDLQS